MRKRSLSPLFALLPLLGWSAAPLAAADEPRARVMVLIQEKGASDYWESLGLAENALNGVLVEKGYQVLDPGEAKQRFPRQQISQSIDGNAQSSLAVGKQAGVEVLILGKAGVTNQGAIMGLSMISIRADITARAILVRNGKILATKDVREVAVGLSESAGGADALRKAGKKLGEQFLSVLGTIPGPDTRGPAIAILSPPVSNGVAVAAPDRGLNVSGTAKDESRVVKVAINGRKVDISPLPDGVSFEMELPAPGAGGEINVSAVDEYGNASTLKVSLRGAREERWKDLVRTLTDSLLKQTPGPGSVYVAELRNGAKDGLYHPNMKLIRDFLLAALSSAGIPTTADAATPQSRLETSYLLGGTGLSLNTRLIAAGDGSILGSATAELPREFFPDGLLKRDLKDIAHELVRKLEEAIAGDEYSLVLEEISGGRSEREGRTGAFSERIKAELKEEITQSGSFGLRSAGAAADAGRKAGELKGYYAATGEEIVIRLALVSGGKELAVVSTRLTADSLPQGMTPLQ